MALTKTLLLSSGVETGGSGGSMNRGPRAPGARVRAATKNLGKKIRKQ